LKILKNILKRRSGLCSRPYYDNRGYGLRPAFVIFKIKMAGYRLF
jgi:hypothetical protein